jgi:methane/ammonia monooxygenase subunit A
MAIPRNPPGASEARGGWRPYDILFVTIGLLGTGVFFHLALMLLAGDWDFWTDWKDRQWWPLLTPAVTIFVASIAQYLAWAQLRIPSGATVAALSGFLFAYSSRIFQFGGWVGFPLNFVWPAGFILQAILLDVILLRTRSFLVTGMVGGFLWGFLFLASNWVAVVPFWQPVETAAGVLTVADLQGMEYLRTQTHEYLRLVESGILRIYAGDPAPFVMIFAGFLSAGVYFLGHLFGRVAMSASGKAVKRIP